MGNERRRQKKLERKRKKRLVAQKRARVSSVEAYDRALVRRAVNYPFGPCFVSAGWDVEDEPELVSLLITRRAPDGAMVAAMALVDRTCLGVKNGYARALDGPRALAEMVEMIGRVHGGIEPCDLLFAQSILFHAIDYAAQFGFAPHRDFPLPLAGVRPAALLDTPWSRVERPFYMDGPDDDVARILARLDAVVGEGNYDFVSESELFDDYEEP